MRNLFDLYREDPLDLKRPVGSISSTSVLGLDDKATKIQAIRAMIGISTLLLMKQ